MVKIIAKTDEKTLNALKVKHRFKLYLNSNGRRVSKVLEVEVISEVRIIRCQYCGCEIEKGMACEDCKERHN